MGSNARYKDFWTQTLGLLALLFGIADAHAESLINNAQGAHQRVPAVRVQSGPCSVVANTIERANPCTISVAWYDPTSCRYGDQVWRESVARKPGVCALSGIHINPGDAVFVPNSMRRRALDAGVMILCTAAEAHF